MKEELIVMKPLVNLVVIIGIVLVTGCQPAAASSEAATAPIPSTLPIPTGNGSSTEGVDMSTPSINSDPKAERMIQLARESLAKQFYISEDEIRLATVKSVLWPDASLGCPEPGVIYAQVVTPGFQILFKANGKSFTYHTDETEQVVLCGVGPPHEIFLPP